jgi:hypothetical protein
LFSRYLLLEFIHERVAMRDDQALPLNRDEGRREETPAPPGGSSTPQADGTSSDPRADAPATVSSAPHLADAEEPGMSDEEIAMYRRRVADGMYNTREVAAEVARRMMRRGDI